MLQWAPSASQSGECLRLGSESENQASDNNKTTTNQRPEMCSAVQCSAVYNNTGNTVLAVVAWPALPDSEQENIVRS